MNKLIICILALLGFIEVQAQTNYIQEERQSSEARIREAEQITLSLLTCDAGQDIYTLFGHTALRYQNPQQDIDIVFNYGIFDFNTPNFIFRFALGQTDYLLGVYPYERFAAEYKYYGRTVWQQNLLLNAEDKWHLIEQLEENYLPENRMYRYNFFYDNCATRPRLQIEKAVSGGVDYPTPLDQLSGHTFRQLLHRYTEGHPWSRLGMDLCLGPQADRPISRRDELFVPFLLMDEISQARHAQTGQPIAAPVTTLIDMDKQTPDTDFWNIATPNLCSILLLMLVVAATGWGVHQHRSLWAVDLFLYAAISLAGCILGFLTLWSEHPAVSPNWLLIVFNPILLPCLPCALLRIKKHRLSRLVATNTCILILFLVFWPFIPQDMPISVVPLALCLLVRAWSNYKLSRV